ncbi:glycoside hydrolase family 3 N-terminal domain-containing protein [uncultured Alistipes sp.]|uniref:glycoside hydrolase family 3 N-terminal domain-containing protein n=1 Tax=uncultured Alistipes sp. TaxID=538949 RepID=UPI0025D857F3|nr:glycoside hydrolase family 3 N-terminal domain-containing protein [uncultured Alistipes sp.]
MKLKFSLLTALSAALLAAGCSTSPRSSQYDPETEKKIENLLGQMTLEEKIGQTNQLSCYFVPEEMAQVLRSGAVGSVLNALTPEVANQLQRYAVEESRLGIPIIISRDVIHGYKTVFPIPLGQAATFDPELVEQGARAAAVEATAAGIRWTFSPMLDIARDPRWGRIAEGSGEDPYLTTVMGAAMTRGYQGNGIGDPTCMAACAKHFVGYGAAEGGRDYNSTNIPERLLRNVYLPPFEESVRNCGAMTVMTSFNDNDGVPSTANSWLLKQVLRDEWGFDGMVVTDWNSAGELIAHGFAADEADAARLSLTAGVDMDMMSHTYFNHIADLIRDGKVSEKQLDDAVRNILRLKFRLGLFDNPYVDPELSTRVNYCEEHLAAARRCALESAVLLQNENRVLPFDPSKIKRLLVTGPLADAPYEQMGTWTFDGEASHTVTPLAALRETYGDRIQIDYEPVLAYSRDTATPAELAALTARAARADAVLVVVGEEAILSGEAHCLGDLNLQGSQRELMAAARRSGKPVATIIMAGRPLTIAEDLKNTDALLYAFHPGTMGGPALVDLLFGVASPSGKTPVTFPMVVGQIPIHYNHNMTGRPAAGTETLLKDTPVGAGQTSLGCTSFLLDAGFHPLYPFGYGLSYTTFEYDEIALDKQEYAADDTIRVSFRLSNTGDRDATEVAQLYVRDLVGSISRPVKELKAFARIDLKAGESRRVEFELPVGQLAFWGLDMQKRVEPGAFQLWVAGDSNSGEPIPFNVK